MIEKAAILCIAMTPGWQLLDYRPVNTLRQASLGKVEISEITIACGSWDRTAFRIPDDVVYMRALGWRTKIKK